MSTYKNNIQETYKNISIQMPKKFKPSLAIITDNLTKLKYNFFGGYEIYSRIQLQKISPLFSELEPLPETELIFARICNKDIIIISGRIYYYEGYTMKDITHIIYVLKFSGIKKIISIDEVATLNPRYKCGELALIYDHINFMGDNPLIGENDEELGIRFPDMSNAYCNELFNKTYKIFQEEKIRINESVYFGIIGPESETEAEVRFYRYAGADVLGYSFVPENIASVHAGIKFSAVGLITRELLADKMMKDETTAEEKVILKNKYLNTSYKELRKVIRKIIEKI